MLALACANNNSMLEEITEAIKACSTLTLLLCAVGILTWVPWLINRWRFRHIPGPFAPPILGNLPGIAQLDMHGFLDYCGKKYGKIFKIYVGSGMIVCVSEPSTAKRLLSKLTFRHAGIQLLGGKDDWNFLTGGLVGANGAEWHRLRNAWQPAFSPSALKSYLPATNAGLDDLIERLAPAAASGEEVNLSRQLEEMMLSVVGNSAYGIDLTTLPQLPSQDQQLQPEEEPDCSFLQVMKAVFAGGGVANSSNYVVFVLLFPALLPLVQWVAYHWPDAKLRSLSKARSSMRQISLKLVQAWRSRDQPRGLAATNAVQADPDSAAGPGNQVLSPLSDRDQQNAVSARQWSHQQELPPPGAFPAQLLSARDKETGMQLSDEQVVAQFNNFLIAAFETTASAIAFCIYCIARDPAVEARLMQELDDFAKQKRDKSQAVGFEDLGQLPYVDAIIKETLRLLPPGAIASRSTEEGGFQLTPQVWLPPRTALFGCTYVFQRDPDYWPAANEFKPERWLQEGTHLQPSTPDAYMPFGAGGRLCVGRAFANQVIAVALVRLFQRYSFDLGPGQEPLPLKQLFALVPADGLRVRLRKHTLCT